MAETLSFMTAKALAMTAIDVLITPGLPNKITEEFLNSMKTE